jgi:Copper type II ascorbate-dependent monooxygenase, C-terminal domain
MRPVAAALLLAACNAPPAAHPPDYHHDVAPLLAAYCRDCHQPGGVAPVPSLDEYEDVKSYLQPIQVAVETRGMPPWGADNSGSCGTWRDARWMSDADLATVTRWLKDGAPEGVPEAISGATVLPLPFRADAALDIGGVYKPGLGPGGNRCFLADPRLDRDRLLGAIRVVADDPRGIGQVTLFALDGGDGEAAALDAADPGLGYGCFGTARAAGARLVASWTRPTPVLRLPAGARLPAGGKLVIQIHYDVAFTGSAFASGTRVELELDDQLAEAGVITVSAAGPLAPGLASVSVEGRQPIGGCLRVVGVAPRMHIRGHAMTVTREGGECLADFPSWHVYDQQLFRAISPRILEAGDAVHISCTYNTEGRTAPVVFGDGIDDEECVAYLFVTGC